MHSHNSLERFYVEFLPRAVFERLRQRGLTPNGRQEKQAQFHVVPLVRVSQGVSSVSRSLKLEELLPRQLIEVPCRV
jgi:hypothetical protein